MARGDFPSAKQDQYMVRFPDGMRERIREEAERNGRSMNSEIIARLLQTLDESQKFAVQPSLFDTINELNDKLKDVQLLNEKLFDLDFDNHEKLQNFPIKKKSYTIDPDIEISFRIGRYYNIQTLMNGSIVNSYVNVKAWDAPILRYDDNHGNEVIINVSSPSFFYAIPAPRPEELEHIDSLKTKPANK